jgi:hypothetical protein
VPWFQVVAIVASWFGEIDMVADMALGDRQVQPWVDGLKVAMMARATLAAVTVTAAAMVRLQAVG